ncbi:hypothetical protein HMPREF1988_02133 [Porphyromonas gingivalis F0185]|nr:hypothetical protein HMPREF1988_02133 [Porphyromonas gingivalis F0185]
MDLPSIRRVHTTSIDKIARYYKLDLPSIRRVHTTLSEVYHFK